MLNDVGPSAKIRRQMPSPTPDKILGRPNIKPSAKVCRQLLPVNHAEVVATLDNEYRKHIAEKSKQWNYDFEKDEPMRTQDGFQWRQCQRTGKENGEGSGDSWVALLTGNDNGDDEVFYSITSEITGSHRPKPRERLYGISEDPDEISHDIATTIGSSHMDSTA